MNMDTKTKIATVFMVALLVGTIGYTMYDIGYTQATIHLSESFDTDDSKDFDGYMTFTVTKEDGSSVIAWEGHNSITTAGLNAIREQIAGTQTADFDYIAIGSGTGGTTTLNAEEFRAQGTYATGTTGVYTITYTWNAGTFTAETITEAGCFNAAADGIMLNYQTFSGIALTATDSLEVEFEFTIS